MKSGKKLSRFRLNPPQIFPKLEEIFDIFIYYLGESCLHVLPIFTWFLQYSIIGDFFNWNLENFKGYFLNRDWFSGFVFKIHSLKSPFAYFILCSSATHCNKKLLWKHVWRWEENAYGGGQKSRRKQRKAIRRSGYYMQISRSHLFTMQFKSYLLGPRTHQRKEWTFVQKGFFHH